MIRSPAPGGDLAESRMKIRLLVIGTRPEDWVRDAVSLYLARLPAHLKPELVEIPLSLRSSGGDPAVAKAKEGQRILQRIKPGDFVVTLDERRAGPGRPTDLARELTRWQNHQPSVALVIGGPEGLADDVMARANQSWSLLCPDVSPRPRPGDRRRAALSRVDDSPGPSLPQGLNVQRREPAREPICLSRLRLPRRQELLAQLGVRFEVLPVAVDEDTAAGESAADLVCRLASAKALAGVALPRRTRERPVVAADTSVALGAELFAKPARPGGRHPDPGPACRAAPMPCSPPWPSRTDSGSGSSSVRSEVTFRALSSRGNRRLLAHRRAGRQGRRLCHTGPRRAVHRRPPGQLLGRHGPAPVRDGPPADPVRLQAARPRAVTEEILINLTAREVRAAVVEKAASSGRS